MEINLGKYRPPDSVVWNSTCVLLLSFYFNHNVSSKEVSTIYHYMSNAFSKCGIFEISLTAIFKYLKSLEKINVKRTLNCSNISLEIH